MASKLSNTTAALCLRQTRGCQVTKVFSRNEYITKDRKALMKKFNTISTLKNDTCLGNGASGVVYRHEATEVGFVGFPKH